MSDNSVIDTAYFDSLVAQIEAVNVCAELQKLEQEALDSISKLTAGVNSQMAALEPIAKLLTNPGAALVEIAQWIENYIESVLKPLYQPYLTYVQQVEQYAQQLERVTQALVDAANRVGNCPIASTLPSVPSSPISSGGNQ